MANDSPRPKRTNDPPVDKPHLKRIAPSGDRVPPHNTDLEMAVLGAFMQDKDAYGQVSTFMNPEVFYPDAHRHIFSAITRLAQNSNPIDIITVTEELKTMDKLEAIGGPHYLVELTNKVASAANIEYHCRVLYEKYMRRQIITNALKSVDDAYSLSKNVFDITDDIVLKTRFDNPNAMIKYEKMSETMEKGSKEKPSLHLIGNLFKENDVGILFGDEGCGKSVLAMQMAAAAASGTDPFQLQVAESGLDLDGLRNMCPPKKVIFYDFELERSEIYERYMSMHDGIEGSSVSMKEFHDNFLRAYIDPQFLDLENTDKKIIAEIELGIAREKPELVIVDNITFISKEAQDPQIAARLMMTLKRIQQENRGLTIIVIAHTPKRDSFMPMESKHIAGSKSIPNYAKSVVAVGKNKTDVSKRYLKHIKCRNGKEIHGYDNVVECVIDKNGVDLSFVVTGYGNERDHITILDIEDKVDLCHQEIQDHHIGSSDFSWRSIALLMEEQYDVSLSHTTWIRNHKKWKAKRDRAQERGENPFQESA